MNSKLYYRKKLTVKACAESLDDVQAFVRSCNDDEKKARELTGEDELVLEELFMAVINAIGDEASYVDVTYHKKISEIYVELDYDGARFLVIKRMESLDELRYEMLSKFSERIGVKHKRGHNTVALLLSRRYDNVWFANIVATVLAITIGMFLFYCTDDNIQEYAYSFVHRGEEIFKTALVMISAPVTFFSFVTNITDSYVNAERSVNIKRLVGNIAISSVSAVILGFVYYIIVSSHDWLKESTRLEGISTSVDLISKGEILMPENIFEAFTVSSPFPLLILATMTACALCSMNADFDQAKRLNDTINSIFSKVLSGIYYLIPIALFLSVVDAALWIGMKMIARYIFIIICCAIGLMLLFLFNLIRLTLSGVNAIKFFKVCRPALKQNFVINSPIEAAPYNTRFCNRKLGIKLRFAESAVPIVSQLNLDGNCFYLVFLTLTSGNMAGIKFNVPMLIYIGIMVLGLSLGAPNQPGSLMLGLIITISYIGDVSAVISAVIFIEAFVCRQLTLANTMSNLTTLYTQAKKQGCLNEGRQL